MSADLQSDRLRRTLDSVQELFDQAVVLEDNNSIAKLSRTIATLTQHLARAYADEKKVVSADEVRSLMDRLAGIIIDECQPHVTPETWAQIVDAVITRASEL